MFFYYSTVTLFAKFWGLSISLFKFLATSTENIHNGIRGRKGVNIVWDSGISIISSYMSVTVSHSVITPKTTQFLDFISITFDIVFSLPSCRGGCGEIRKVRITEEFIGKQLFVGKSGAPHAPRRGGNIFRLRKNYNIWAS